MTHWIISDRWYFRIFSPFTILIHDKVSTLKKKKNLVEVLHRLEWECRRALCFIKTRTSFDLTRCPVSMKRSCRLRLSEELPEPIFQNYHFNNSQNSTTFMCSFPFDDNCTDSLFTFDIQVEKISSEETLWFVWVFVKWRTMNEKFPRAIEKRKRK